MRSDQVKKGVERAPHRSLRKGTGNFTDADMDKPFIAVANTMEFLLKEGKREVETDDDTDPADGPEAADDAADITFTSVSGPSIEAIILFADTGTESTSPLIAYIDTATGLPITPNGGDIIVTWDNGANKIFKV